MTDNPKHTPGPWTHRSIPGHVFEILSGEHIVFRVRSGMMPVLADADLLAAAPDLLEELKMAEARLDFLTNWLEFTYHGAPADVRNGRAYAAAARAAIAKAEGGAA